MKNPYSPEAAGMYEAWQQGYDACLADIAGFAGLPDADKREIMQEMTDAVTDQRLSQFEKAWEKTA